MTAFVSVVCQNPNCGNKFNARRAAIRRGWAKFCSKSCKAVVQEARTGQYAKMIFGKPPETRKERADLLELIEIKMSRGGEPWDDHKFGENS